MKDKFLAVPAYVSPEGKIHLKTNPMSGLIETQKEAESWAEEQLAGNPVSGVNTYYVLHTQSIVSRSPNPVTITPTKAA